MLPGYAKLVLIGRIGSPCTCEIPPKKISETEHFHPSENVSDLDSLLPFGHDVPEIIQISPVMPNLATGHSSLSRPRFPDLPRASHIGGRRGGRPGHAPTPKVPERRPSYLLAPLKGQ